MEAGPNGYVLTCEMTVTRQQPDGTERVEQITVETDYDAQGNVISQTEVTDA
jgi:YD repeat-containing protein